MDMELTHIIQQKAEQTNQEIQKKKEVPVKSLDELAKAIKDLPATSSGITSVHRSNIEKAIESLSAVDQMINNLKRESDKAQEAGEREHVVAPFTYVPIPVPEMIQDLKQFLRLGRKVEKSNKSRTR